MTSIAVAKQRAPFLCFRFSAVFLILLSVSCSPFQVMAKKSRSPLSLSVEGWASDSEAENDDRSRPGRKKLKLSLSKNKNSERFEFISGAEVETLGKKFVPKNTESSTKWALTNYLLWRDKRNATFSDKPSEQVLQDLLASKDAAEISKWFTFYVAETRRKDGSEYPPKTIYLLLTGLLRHMRSRNAACPNFLDTSDPSFAAFHNALDNVFRGLRTRGVGAQARQTEAFSKEDEDCLWEAGILGSHSPKCLLDTVFFLNGKNFCLRGGVEQRQLKLSQFKRLQDPHRYVYTENVSKNRAGGLAHMRVKNKSVVITAVPESPERCHVMLLDMYFSMLPAEAFEKDNFYVQPVTSVDPSKPWFTSKPIGRNTMNGMVKDICSKGKITGNKTNQSLRATGVSELFQAGVPEKLIQERSGHP